MAASPVFELRDAAGAAHEFPPERVTVLGFAGQGAAGDYTLALLQAAFEAFGGSVDVFAVFAAGTPVPDDLPDIARFDPDGGAAAALSIEAVPAVVLLGRDGDVRQRIDGFDRAGWQRLFERLITHALAPAPLVDWAAFPTSLPPAPVAR